LERGIKFVEAKLDFGSASLRFNGGFGSNDSLLFEFGIDGAKTIQFLEACARAVLDQGFFSGGSPGVLTECFEVASALVRDVGVDGCAPEKLTRCYLFGLQIGDGLLSVSLRVVGVSHGSLGGFDRSLLSINASLKSLDGRGKRVGISGNGVYFSGKVGGIGLHFLSFFAQFTRRLS
jgi:hypothetical protein